MPPALLAAPRPFEVKYSNDRSAPTNALNAGSASSTIMVATSIAMSAVATDSPRNCTMSWTRDAPSDFRTPTSRARFAERAVDRFMKLMQAIKRIIAAIVADA